MYTFFPRTNATTCNLSTNNASSTIDAWSTMSSCTNQRINAKCSDCATKEINVLQQLLPLSLSISTCSLSSQHQ